MAKLEELIWEPDFIGPPGATAGHAGIPSTGPTN